MELPATFVLVAGSAAVNGLLAGASLDQSFKQLPARFTIGHIEYSKCSRAADLGNGVPLYVTLGVGGALLTIAAAWAAHRDCVPSAAATPYTSEPPWRCSTQSVKNLETAKHFYEERLGLTNVMENEEVLAFTIGKWTLFVYRSQFAGTSIRMLETGA